jgi:hypothetical protein
MSMESHIAELVRRHAALEREIETAQMQPGTDALQVTEMKRRKLHLKEEIERLRQPVSIH